MHYVQIKFIVIQTNQDLFVDGFKMQKSWFFAKCLFLDC